MAYPIGRADLADTLTLVLAGGQGERLYPLTRDRAKPAVPFGGAYRIIDFTLSNCLNSGLRRIYVLTQYKSLSLDRHIRQGWQLFNEALGEFIVPMPPQQRLGGSWYTGTADAIYQNIYTLERERPGCVLVLSGDHIYKMDYGKMIAFHREAGADMTVACIEVPIEEARYFGLAVIDENHRIVEWQEKPEAPRCLPGSKDRCLASMGVYVFDTKALVRKVSRDAKRSSDHDFGKDVIPDMISSDRVFAYPFEDENRGGEPYWRDIGRIDAYFEANMDLTRPEPQFHLHDPRWPIWTNPVHASPAKIVRSAGGRTGFVEDCVLANGAVLSGCRVESSVVGYHVKILDGADVSGAILMDGVTVGEGARIRNAIVDKRVGIPAGESIGCDPERDAKRFRVSAKGVAVVPKELAME